jgi:hypothetical protein
MAGIREHAKEMAIMNSTIVTRKSGGAISETEELLTTWTDPQIKKHVPQT